MKTLILFSLFFAVDSTLAATNLIGVLEETSSSLRRCDGVPTVPSNRRACGLFLWDAPSAFLYKWCHHLLKDHLIEGRGGHMYVRFESNSILQLLYPCSRFSPNKCLVCGGSYFDHLELWWSKKLYTPFDRHLDRVYQAALTVRETGIDALLKNKRKSTKSKEPVIVGPPTYSFHREYVYDVSDILREEKDRKKQLQQIVKKYSPDRKPLKGWTMQTFPAFQVGYIVPPFEGGKEKKPSVFYGMVRSIVLGAFNDFLYMQEIENSKIKGKH